MRIVVPRPLPALPSWTVRRRFQFANPLVRCFAVRLRPDSGPMPRPVNSGGHHTVPRPALPERPNFAFCTTVGRGFAFSRALPSGSGKRADKSSTRGLNRPDGAVFLTLFGRCPANLKPSRRTVPKLGRLHPARQGLVSKVESNTKYGGKCGFPAG